MRKTARQRYTAKKAINCEWLEGIPWPVPLPAGHGMGAAAERNGQVWDGRGSEKGGERGRTRRAWLLDDALEDVAKDLVRQDSCAMQDK